MLLSTSTLLMMTILPQMIMHSFSIHTFVQITAGVSQSVSSALLWIDFRIDILA
jgi:hypothetical protein